MKTTTAHTPGPDAPYMGDWCYGHGITGFQQPIENCSICFPPNLVEWRYRTASKLLPAHAYRVGINHAADCQCDVLGLCGRGENKKWTKSMNGAQVKRRKNTIWKCPRCVTLATLPGEARAATAKTESQEAR